MWGAICLTSLHFYIIWCPWIYLIWAQDHVVWLYWVKTHVKDKKADLEHFIISCCTAAKASVSGLPFPLQSSTILHLSQYYICIGIDTGILVQLRQVLLSIHELFSHHGARSWEVVPNRVFSHFCNLLIIFEDANCLGCPLQW